MKAGFAKQSWAIAARCAVSFACALALAACQPTTPGQLQVLGPDDTGVVNFQLNVPRKVSKPVRAVQATGDESSTLLVNKVDVSLDGPGFFRPLYPQGYTNGEIAVQSGSISSHIDFVPTGRNRFLKVIAWNGDKKLNQVGGVLDVQPGPYNHVVVGLSTTPTEQVIEKLSLKAPEAARAISAESLQYFLDTYVTRPVTDSATNQNTFAGVHPYLVNADGLVDYLIANNFQIPSDFDPTRPTDKTFVLNSGSVHLTTGGLPVGSRIWLNDPTSSILVTTDAAKTTYDVDAIAPNFDPGADGLSHPWTLTVLTPDGRVATIDLTIPRQTLAQGPLSAIDIDLTSKLQNANAQIKRIFLSPTNKDWAGTSITLNGRVAQQLFVYAEDQQGNVISLLPNALAWQSLDTARVKVGNGTALASGNTSLNGMDVEDYGLVYPLAETDPNNPADVATVQGTLKGTSLTAQMPFRIGYLGNDTGLVKVDVVADDLHVLQGDQTLPDMLQSVPLTAVEPEAPAGTTYRWVSDNPAVVLGDGTGATIAAKAIGDLGSGFATVTVLSSTGRQATVKVLTAFGKGTVSTSAEATAFTAAFNALPGLNASNPSFTANSGYPLGGYLNTINGQATIGVSDTAVPGAKYFFRSSDPFTISVSGLFPASTATLTAMRPGTVTITAMDEYGHTVSSQVKSNFDKVGTVTTSVQAPVNPIGLVTKQEPQIQADLNAVFAKGTYQASETGNASPAFRWISLDTSTLVITPPAGQSFPNAYATFQALRPGPVSFKVVSAATGQSKVFNLNLTFANGTAKTSVTAPGLLVKTLGGTTVGSVVSKTLGELLSFQALDWNVNNPAYVWTSDNPAGVAVVSQSGNQVQLRVLDYGTTTIRVRNTNNGHAATLSVDVQKTGKGNGAITVTL